MRGHNKPGVGKASGPARPDQAEYESYIRLLNELEGNPDLVSGVGRSRLERRMIAERLIQESQDTRDIVMAMSYALRAVRLSPEALDARVALALAAGGPKEEFMEELEAIVAAGEADLGPEFFRQNRGHFWGMIESRPYMRARGRLAYELYSLGRVTDAIHHFEAMLLLSPDDNQGFRHYLLGMYLETGDVAGASRLFTAYSQDWGAVPLWGRVLTEYLSGDLDAAAKTLQKARAQNPHVEAFISGRKKIPRSPADNYLVGDVSEAVMCMDTLGTAWAKHPEAVQWLKAQSGSRNPSRQRATKGRAGKAGKAGKDGKNRKDGKDGKDGYTM
jgi:tetratricopeptide (TPR) repeat protein